MSDQKIKSAGDLHKALSAYTTATLKFIRAHQKILVMILAVLSLLISVIPLVGIVWCISFRKLEFSRKDSSCGYAWLSFSRITGSPAADAAGEYIVTDTRYLHADDYDRQLFEKKSFPVFLTEFQECIRTDDRKTIARMIDFPAELSGKLYFTRSEFLRDYQKIFHSERKKAVLETTIDEVDFNWRGTWMPDGITLNASMENAGPICFIH